MKSLELVKEKPSNKRGIVFYLIPVGYIVGQFRRVIVGSEDSPPPEGIRPTYRQADANEERNYILSMEQIRKLGEVEKAVWQILDKNTPMSHAWNDQGIRAQTSIAAGVAVIEREFPAITGTIHEAGFSTLEYVVCYLTEQKTIGAVVSKMTGKQKEYSPYVNRTNAALIE